MKLFVYITLFELCGHIFLTCVVLFLSVTGASRGYAFVEYETEREMRRAYKVLQLISNLKYYIPLSIFYK
jgi:RNA recognition motif-containing protein